MGATSLQQNPSANLVYLAVVIGSVAVALWTHYIDPIINPDGVKYVLAAQSFFDADFATGFAAYKWPAYSLIIAGLSKVTSLSLEMSALVINAIFRCLAGLAFIRASQLVGVEQKQLWLAAAVFVFYPGLNEVQSMIIRDFAYLACFMWMVVFFLQQTTNPTNRNLSGFIIFGLLATVFRIEGVVFVCGMLLYYLFTGAVNQKTKRYGFLFIVILLPALVYGALTWIYDGEAGRTFTVLSSMISQMEIDLSDFIDNLETSWLQTVMDKSFYVVLFFIPIGKLTGSILEVLTIGYALTLLVGWFCRRHLSKSNPRTRLLFSGWRWVIGINFLMLIGFVMITQIVTDRYPLSLCLLLMLMIPSALKAIYNGAKSISRPRLIFASITMVALLLINSIEGLDRVSSKYHLKQAGQWIKSQKGDSNDVRIYSNNRILDYYSGQTTVHPYDYYSNRMVNELMLSHQWTGLDFLTISLSRNDTPGFYRSFRYRIGKEPDKLFENHKGDKVLVYDFRDLQPL